MTAMRDPQIVALVDEVMSMAPAPPPFPDALHRPVRSRRPLIVVAIATLVIGVVVIALVVASPWSRTEHEPSIVSAGGGEASPSTPPPVITTLPLLTPA